MIVHAFNLAIFSLLFFIMGMFKPNWALFFLKKPDRFLVLVISTVLFMITMTMYGAGTKELKEEKEKAAMIKKSTDSNSTPVPVPVPTPDKTTSEKKPL